MSILTKIGIVILLVLILFACTVFISLATVAPNWRHAYEAETIKSSDLDVGLKNAMLVNQQVIIERDAAAKTLRDARAQMQEKLDTVSQQRDSLRIQAANFQNQLKRMGADIAAIKVEAKNANERTDLLAAQLEQQRKEADALNKENISLTDDLKQNEAARDRYKKLAESYEESIVALEEENEQLRKSGATVADEAAPLSVDRIEGTVDAVRGDIASINIGSAKGIKRGMRLYVFRGTEFVAFLRIDEVRLDEAAGMILDRRLDPMPNDKVATRLTD